MQTAGLLAMFLGFGLALTQISVQTYINRRVPHSYQGRTFALQSMLKNNLAIFPLLTLGLLATAFTVEAVLVAAPFFLLALAVGLVRLSYAVGGEEQPGRFGVVRTYWEESNLPIVPPVDDQTPTAPSRAPSGDAATHFAETAAAEDGGDTEHERT
jgi:MFS family permease